MAHDQLPEFDDAVARAMAKWPDVPACFGWLGLDRRGAWRIRGDVIVHARTIEFLSRHYRGDEHGRWFIQNGPQRVFIELEYTPWVYRYDGHGGFSSHTGINCNELDGVFADDDGNLLLTTGLGVGLVDDRDLVAVSQLIAVASDQSSALHWQQRTLAIERVQRADVADKFGFVAAPTTL
jgi:hypothetical protein